MAWYVTPSGGMYSFPTNLGGRYGRFVGNRPPDAFNPTSRLGMYHNPIHTGIDIFKGANLATNIAQGNFMTRTYRQKPLAGLEFHYHKNPARIRSKLLKKLNQGRAAVVEIPSVSNRRVKEIPQNKILVTSNPKMVTIRGKRRGPTTSQVVKALRTRYPQIPAYKSKKAATNRKNVTRTKARLKTVTQVLQKEVKALKQAVNTINSHHTYKLAGCASVKSLIGRCNHVAYPGSTVTLLESATANLRFFDPAAPATLVTANPNTGTYARDITIKNFYLSTTLRNNYQVPCKVKVYLCKSKLDQSDGVVTTYTNALTDQVINAGVDETDALLHVTEIERMKEMWAIDCVIDKVLEPGQEVSTSHSTGQFQYDPSHVDLVSDVYQKGLNSFDLLIRVEGVLGHDSAVATEQSLLLAGVDVMNHIKVNITYNSGGADLDDIYISEGRIQAFTNGGVASLKPVADNLAYSIA